MFWGFNSANSEITTSRRLSGSEGFGHYLMKKVFGHPKSVPGGVERQYFGYTPQVAWQGRTWLQGAPHSAEEESETATWGVYPPVFFFIADTWAAQR